MENVGSEGGQLQTVWSVRQTLQISTSGIFFSYCLSLEKKKERKNLFTQQPVVYTQCTVYSTLYSGQYQEHLDWTSVYCEMKEKSFFMILVDTSQT